MGLGAAATAFTGLSIKALQLTGELEQNIGGSEAVFREFADTVQNIGATAFETMGLSASDFMATANKMGALMQGSGLDIETSMNLSTQAMQRAADVASIMGIDTTSAMESIAGAAKGNFTMMDNLGVAMNATTIEAYALEKGIKTSWKEMDNATKVTLAMEMFLEKTAYATGNYAKENQTLAGSLSTARAALKNFLSGAGDVSGVVKSFSNAADVIVKNMRDLLPRLTKGIVEIVKGLSPQIPVLMAELLPPIVDGAVALITGFASAIISNLPMIIDVGKQIVSSLLNGISDIIPLLSPITSALSFLSDMLLEITPIAATFFAVWKGTEFLAFLELSGGVAGALDTIRNATELLTLAKLNDIKETIILNALYAKDFIVNLGKTTIALIDQGKQFVITTAKKGLDTYATWAAAAAAEGMTFAQFALNKAMESSVVQWIISTAKKGADVIATGALAIATGALTIASKAATAAQWLWNAAMTANPIGLFVVAIAGLIAGITALVKWLGKGKKEQEDLSKSTDNLKNSQIQLTETYGETEKAIESYAKITTNMFSKINTESEISVQEMITNLRENQQAVSDWSRNLEILARRGIDEGLLQSLKDAGPEAARHVAAIKNSTDIELQALSRAFAKGGEDSIAGLAEGMRKTVTGREFGGRVGEITNNIVGEFNRGLKINSPSKVFMEMGKFSMEGFIQGLSSMLSKVQSTIKSIANTVVSGFRNILGIHSPSTVFAEFGKNLDQGFINGVLGMAGDVNKAVDSVFGGLGGNIDYGLNIAANGSRTSRSTAFSAVTSPSAHTGSPIYVTLNLKADDLDSIAKVVRVFESFPHNNVVFGGVQ